jgi:hypothetical protein
MNTPVNQWALFELGGLLKRTNMNGSFTFLANIPANPELGTPAMIVGLGWFEAGNKTLNHASFIPLLNDTFSNSVISEVTETYLEAMQVEPEQWQRYILLRKGYVSDSINFASHESVSLSSLGLDDLKVLEKSYMFEEILFLCFAGMHEQPLEWITVLREAKKKDPEFQFMEALTFTRIGVQADQFESARGLPTDLLEALYG